jgi:hypothetical protein
MSGDYSASNRVVTWRNTILTQGEEIEFPGTNNEVLTVPDSDDWAFTGEFCIELFGVKFDNNTAIHGLISSYNASGNQRSWALDFDGTASPNKQLRGRLSTDGTATGDAFVELVGTFNPTAGVAYDLCMERDASNVFRLYVDGVMIASTTFAGALFNSNQLLDIGQGSVQTASALNGRLKAVRITRAARYASDSGYVVPALPLPTQG